jgi:hypothetical protein
MLRKIMMVLAIALAFGDTMPATTAFARSGGGGHGGGGGHMGGGMGGGHMGGGGGFGGGGSHGVSDAGRWRPRSSARSGRAARVTSCVPACLHRGKPVREPPREDHVSPL